MKKGKKIFLIILTIIFIIMFLIGVMVVKDLKEEDKLRDDISNINELINSDNPDNKLINKKLKTYVTTGENLSLEKAVKRYYLDSYDLVKKYNNIVNVEKISNLVSINNFMFDGKDFNISKNYINDINNNLDEVVNEVSEQISDKNRNKYFKKYKLDSYYKDLYNEQGHYILYKYCMFIPFYNDYAKRFRFIFVPLHAN